VVQYKTSLTKPLAKSKTTCLTDIGRHYQMANYTFNTEVKTQSLVVKIVKTQISTWSRCTYLVKRITPMYALC